MQVERLHHLDACRHLAAAWDCMAHGIPFRRTAWLLNWWHYYQQLGDLYVLQVTNDAGQVVGVAPWFLQHTLRHGRVVRPLGTGVACSEYLGILTTPEHEQQVSVALAAWLSAAAAGECEAEDRWDLLDLDSVEAGDTCMTRLFEQLEEPGHRLHRRAAMSCWRIELPGSWNDYLQMLGRSQRKRVRRAQRQWLDSGRAKLITVTEVDQFEDAMKVLVRLHQQRQESVGNRGCFADLVFSDFLHAAGKALLGEQLLQLHWLELDKQPIAAELQLIAADTTYAYLGGMDCQLEGYSPGQMIQIAVLRRCMEQGHRVFDFLRGDEVYKSHWGVQEHPCFDYRVVPPKHSAQLRHQAWLAGGMMKRWLRSSLSKAGVF